MRLSKFLSIINLTTLFCLLYVYQQTEIFRLAYMYQKSLGCYESLLDKNSILRYNIKRNSSLVRISNKVSKVADLQLPENYRLVKLSFPQQENKIKGQVPQRQNLLSRLLTIKRHAEAKPINSIASPR